MTTVPFSASIATKTESHYPAIVGQASAFAEPQLPLLQASWQLPPAEPQRQISRRPRNNSRPSPVSQSTDANIGVSWRDLMHCPGRPPGKSKEFELFSFDKRLNPVRRPS